MKRLFVPASRVTTPRTRLQGAEVRHLRALRLRAGSHLTIFDDRDQAHESVVLSIGPRMAELEILRTSRTTPSSGPQITLIAGILKGQRMDLLVEKTTELGVSRIVPTLTERTVARPAQPDGARTQRWRRLAISASSQCGQTRIPSVEPPARFLDVIESQPTDALRILFWEEEKAVTLPALQQSWPRPSQIVIAIGPEGGFTNQEVGSARAAGFEVSGLGPRTLRAETAAIVSVALCQATWGDMTH